MFRKALLATAIIAAFAIPAVPVLAATMAPKAAKAYYVEQSAKTNRCYITTHKPNGKSMKEIGTSSYPTRAKASAAMKAAPECKMKKKA